MSRIKEKLKKGDALIIVDVQKDFCPGGALPIDEGDKVVSVLNGWIEAAIAGGAKVYASRDWHPLGHPSFREEGGPWHDHCIQDSDGARFHRDLALPDSTILVTKGVRFDQDQNSAFDQTGLAEQLRKDGIRRLFIGGLAEDVCVLATVLDGLKEGFEVALITDGTRPVTPEGGRMARAEMSKAGARLLEG